MWSAMCSVMPTRRSGRKKLPNEIRNRRASRQRSWEGFLQEWQELVRKAGEGSALGKEAECKGTAGQRSGHPSSTGRAPALPFPDPIGISRSQSSSPHLAILRGDTLLIK